MNWFCDLSYPQKIFICGNHDDCLYGATIDGLDGNVHYLCNSATEIEGLRFYGIPMFMSDCIFSGIYTPGMERSLFTGQSFPMER